MCVCVYTFTGFFYDFKYMHRPKSVCEVIREELQMRMLSNASDVAV